MHAWPLAALPLASVVVVVSLLERRRISAVAWAGAALLALVAGYPIYGPSMVRSVAVIPTDTTFLSSTSPAVLPLPVTTWGPALGCAVVIAVLWRRLALDPWSTRIVLAAVLAGLLTTGLVAAAQWRNGHGLGGYYLQKTVYLTTLIGFSLVAAVACRVLSATMQRHRPVALAGAAMTMLAMWAPLASPWAITHWTNNDPNLLEMRAVRASLAARSESAIVRSDIVALGTCNDTTSDYTTRWTGTLLRSWSPAREQLVTRLGVEGESLAALRDYALSDDQRTIQVYARSGCPLTTQIQEAALPNVRVHVGG
jgi:hypothetical protein